MASVDLHALVLADGEVPGRADLDRAWPGWDDRIRLVIAADGGAGHAADLGFRVDRLVGDMDSVSPGLLETLAAAGVAIERSSVEKDETDLELALIAAAAGGATRITILGALGGPRVDHALANVGLLGHPVLVGRDVQLYDERAARVSLLLGPVVAVARGRIGDLVSLLPFGATVTGVTTHGLRYPLVAESLVLGRTRGVSNVRTATDARIALEAGRLLVIETPATVGP